MDFCCLGSGSKGNATLIKSQQTLLMIDCGFSLNETINRLTENKCSITDLQAILVTHEHGDHISGVNSLARKYNIPVYTTRGTARSGKLQDVPETRWIDLDNEFNIGDIKINPVSVPHDANEPCQFVFSSGNKKLGVMTDLGSISSHVSSAFDNCDALLIEANHDINMLWAGKYPPTLKERVSSDWGHLSNQQAQTFLQSININRLSTLVLGHISQQNNTVDIVKNHFSEFEQKVKHVIYATQDQGFSWLSV